MNSFIKSCLVGWFITVVVFFFIGVAFAYNPNSFIDEETLTVQGNRPKIDVELSEITINIDPEDFVDGVFEKSIVISNEGNVPCRLKLALEDVPVDLKVEATVDDDFLLKNETTNLNIVVELSEQQETESFTFTIVVEARLR